jgi:hypothetical protein
VGALYFFVLLVLVVGLLATVLLVGAVVGVVGAVVGGSAALGFAVSRTAPTGQGPRPPWWSWLPVTMLGIALSGMFSAGAIVLGASQSDRGAAQIPVVVAALLGGALTGLLHVVLRKRPRRWIVAWTLALGLPAALLSFVALELARTLLGVVRG